MTKQFVPDIQIEELNKTFPKYEFISPLGDGGQAEVFKAKRRLDGKDVAVKIYSPDNLVKRAEMEVEKLEKAHLQYLAKVIEHDTIKFRDMDCYYVVTEYLKGEDLRKTLNKRVLTEEETKILLKNMVLAIDELWRLRVVHCDIKPENILYLDDGTFTLIDLGYAKHLDKESMTVFGTIYGTVGYVAPEQIRGRRSLTLRADLFALGIILYEAVTGKHPFGKNQALIFQGIDPLPVENIIKIEDELAKAINWMLKLNPVKRPSSCQQILTLVEGGN